VNRLAWSTAEREAERRRIMVLHLGGVDAGQVADWTGRPVAYVRRVIAADLPRVLRVKAITKS